MRKRVILIAFYAKDVKNGAIISIEQTSFLISLCEIKK